MPPLRPPTAASRIELPPRTGTLAAETDVLIVGGGPSGLGAALGAAAAGARVILAERYGFLGGNATAALVMPLTSFHAHRDRTPKLDETALFPTDQGPGEPIVAGAFRRLLSRLVRAGGALHPTEATGYTVPFDPEVFKLVALELLDEAGVEYLLHSFASGVTGGNLPDGVVFEGKSGPIVVRARVVVDATGDGDIAALAGARYEIGRASDGLVQPMTLMFRMVEFEREAFAAYVRHHPGQWRGVHGLWDLVERAAAAGELELPREDVLFFGTPHAHEVSVNSTRVTGALGTSVWDLTRAEWESRRQLRQLVAFLRKYVPGFERSYAAQSGVQVGVRETRRIVGEYQLTADDVLEARKFDDVVARGAYPIDIHNPAGPGTVLRRVPLGEAYDIPLRCLLPQEAENLLVAGRCISGTHEAHSSYRVMPISMATGHAAGVCAALAARQRIPPRDVPAGDVQGELLRQHADLGRLNVARQGSAVSLADGRRS
ncbi:MAG TPA: FAD-dependent oxidoreductase [Gemmatimonadales bacterium]